MCNQNLRDINKTKLEGRIYPAIQSCVNNRYKIILGIFAYYGFILLQSGKPWFLNIGCWIHFLNLVVSVIFTIFLIHNTANYLANASEQKEIEDKCGKNEMLQNEGCCYKLGRWIQDKVSIEIYSFFIIFILIWLTFIFTTSVIILQNFKITCDRHY